MIEFSGKIRDHQPVKRSGNWFCFISHLILIKILKLEQVQPVECLRITITDNLDWGLHVSEISCKATKTMGFSSA